MTLATAGKRTATRHRTKAHDTWPRVSSDAVIDAAAAKGSSVVALKSLFKYRI
jgi:hypothetical protein